MKPVPLKLSSVQNQITQSMSALATLSRFVRIGMQDTTKDRPSRSTLLDVLESGKLSAVFQPIVDYREHGYFAFEGLIRGPAGTALHSPLDLFASAEQYELRPRLEAACRETILHAFSRLKLPGRLFLNNSLEGLHDERLLTADGLEGLYRLGIHPSRIVIELTENQHIADYPGIRDLLTRYRANGFKIAIDDLGEGFANLRMWSEVQPDFVKIDRHFINGIATDRLKHHFVKAMQGLAESCSAQIVAEGIETESDLLAVRDLGIAYGQGYLIERPSHSPAHVPTPSISKLLKQTAVLVFPTSSVLPDNVTVRILTRPIEAVTALTSNDVVFRRFESDPTLSALPVVEAGHAIGLINRQEMVNNWARPYGREVFGKKPCASLMDAQPLCIKESASLQEAAMIVSRSTQHHINDGFIVTRKGQYIGLGNTYKLIGLITEMQIQAARYANPLTQLPGNVPINEHIDRLLGGGVAFHACYFDIDNFKPFNDVFGYRKGDDVILILARTLCQHLDGLLDFCGHIGGDDFIVLFQSGDWESRCHAILESFEKQLHEAVSPANLKDDGYYAENRQGRLEHHKLPSLSIGAVNVGAGDYESHREVSSAASDAKRVAKRTAGNSLFIERRRPVNRSEGNPVQAVGLLPDIVLATSLD